jgi:hypothetical protein
MQSGDINAKELNSIGTYAKNVLLLGWDTTALEPVRIACNSSGEIIIDTTGLYSTFVPYTGAVADVDLGAFNLFTTGTIGNLLNPIDELWTNYMSVFGTIQGYTISLSQTSGDQILLGSPPGHGLISYKQDTDSKFYFYNWGFPSYSLAAVNAGATTVTSLDAGSGLIQTTGDIQIGDDLFFPNVNSIINFGSGDITLTYTANILTFAGMTTLDLGTANLTTDFINLKTLTTPLHITKNEASAEPTWNTFNDIVVIENSANTSLQLLTAVGGVANLGFSTTATRINGLIQYNHSTDTMYFNTALTTRLTIVGTLATFSGDLTVSDDLIVSDDCDVVGSLTAGDIQADNGYDGTIPGPEVDKQMVFVGGILTSYELS